MAVVLVCMDGTDYVGILLRCQVQHREPWQNKKLDRSSFILLPNSFARIPGELKSTPGHMQQGCHVSQYTRSLHGVRSITYIYIYIGFGVMQELFKSTEYGVIVIYASPDHEKPTESG